MAFVFVDNNQQIDASHRKVIRSHVMKGKNAGKERPLGSRPRRAEQKARIVAQKTSQSIATTLPYDISIPRSLGNELGYFEFPGQVNSSMLENICRWMRFANLGCYPLASCFPNKVGNAPWFPFMQENEAFFHCILAISASFYDDLVGRGAKSSKALQHFSNAYLSINKSLQQSSVPPDSTVAVVTALTIHEDLRRENFKSRIHLTALQQMVEMRGGVDTFEENRFLLHKMCRADIEHAIHSCSKPRFYRDKFPYELVQATQGYPSPPSSGSGSTSLTEDDSRFTQIYNDLMITCSLLNSESNQPGLDSVAYQDMFISIAYRLLDIYPLTTENTHSDKESAYCLGMISLMSTLLFQHGVSYQQSYHTVRKRLQQTVVGRKGSSRLPDELILWILCVGCISVFADDNSSLLPEVKSCLWRLNIDSWSQAREVLKTFPWIDAIHDEPGRRLWKAALWS